MRESYRLQKNPLAHALAQKQRSFSLFFMYVARDLPDQKTVQEKMGVILNRMLKKLDETGTSNI